MTKQIFITIGFLIANLSSTSLAQNIPEMGDRFAFTTIDGIGPDDSTFGSGFSIYASVWSLFETYPNPDFFQTGLVSAWMTPQPTGNEPTDDFFYNTIEGGLGWWIDTRFAHEAPKFIMGGVSNGFYSWANGPGAGQADIIDGYRDWSAQNGMLDIAQLSPHLLWPPDGLNMSMANNGEFLGYGYLPLPFTEEMSVTNGANITTGDQSWTLFLNTANFKGPIAFFLPTFWTKPVLENLSLEGLFLDTRPSDPLSSFGIETATLPTVHSVDNDGTKYVKALPTLYPISAANESILLNRPIVYSRAALWDKVDSWFNGGPIATTVFTQEGQQEVIFDTQRMDGAAYFESFVSTDPGGDESFEYAIEAYLKPFVKDRHSWGLQFDTTLVEASNGVFKTPSYFRLNDISIEGEPISEEQIPVETGLAPYEFETNTAEPLPYLTPLETDCPWYDPEGVWLNPGPISGPFHVDLEDGSTLTYYWYKFIDQPAVLAANLPDGQRQLLQQRIELIHTHWGKTNEYIPNPSIGNLARLDPGLMVNPPEGFEIGYVPIVTRQAKTNSTGDNDSDSNDDSDADDESNSDGDPDSDSDSDSEDNSDSNDDSDADNDADANDDSNADGDPDSEDDSDSNDDSASEDNSDADNDTDADNVFSIYPNSSSTSFYFSELVNSVKLYSIGGRIVLSAGPVSQIDASILSEGVYIAKIYLQDGTLVEKKLIKK